MEIIGKISVKTVCGSIKKDSIPETGTKFLMRVFGLASGVKTGQSAFGEWVAVTGQFKAIDLGTNNEYQSGKAFLPDVALTLVQGALEQADAESVQFAFDVGIVKDETIGQGYHYTVKPLVDAAENDPLTELENKIKAALPAPEETKAGKK